MKMVKKNPIKKRGKFKQKAIGGLIIVGMGISAIVARVAINPPSVEAPDIMISSPDAKKIEELSKENARLKQELVSRGGERSKRFVMPTTNKLEEMALAECNFIGLDPIVGFAFIHAESRWDIKSVNVNTRKGKTASTDYGLMQLNDRGGELGEAVGKTLTLSDGRKVTVTRENYKTDTLLNLHIGLSAAKEYLDITKNVYAAYGMYNAGIGAYYEGLKNVVGLDKLGMEETCDFMLEYGFAHGAKNIKTNFAKSFDKYLSLKTAQVNNK